MNSTHIKIRESWPVGNSINSIQKYKQLKSETGMKKWQIIFHWYPDHDKEIVLKHIDRDKEREKKWLK